jgi:Glycosyltransferase family 87
VEDQSLKSDHPMVGRFRYVVGNTMALVIALTVAYFALTWSGTVPQELISPKQTDLMQYFSAARLVLEGHGSHIYSFAAVGREEYLLAHPMWQPHHVSPYLYPPALVVLLAPMALLPYLVAYLTWMVVTCVILVAAMYELEKYARLTPRQAFIARFAALASLPVLDCLMLGQLGVLLLGSAVLAFTCLRRQHQMAAGLALSVAVLKPQYCLPLVLLLIFRRQWTAMVAFAVSAAVLLLFPLPLLGSGIYRSYLHAGAVVTGWQGQTKNIFYDHMWINPATYAPDSNHSISGFAQALLPPFGAGALTVVLSALVLAAVAWTAWRSESVEGPFAIAVLAGMLVSPHTLVYDLTLLLLPAAVLLHGAAIGRLFGVFFLVYVGVAASFILAYWSPVHLSVPVFLLLGAWLYRTTVTSTLHERFEGPTSAALERQLLKRSFAPD